MKPLLTLLLSLLCLTASASPGQPYFVRQQSSELDPEKIATTGLAYRWVAEDLTNTLGDNGPVLSWPDRVQGDYWTNGSAAARPSLTNGNSVYFTKNYWLTNDYARWVGSNTLQIMFGFILNVFSTYTAAPSETSTGLLLNNGSGGLYGYSFGGAPVKPLQQWYGASSFVWTETPFRSTNQPIDLIIQQIQTGGGSGDALVYTNGIYVTNGGGLAWQPTANRRPTSLMHNITLNTGPRIYLHELWIWTNSTSDFSGLSPLVLTNFHKYATNKYGYTP